MIFLSADHRLVHPSTGFDIIEDVRALFAFLADPTFSQKYLPDDIQLDPTRIAVIGASGGGYAARAAALYAQPKPKAVFLLYAMGGEFPSDHWVSAKPQLQHYSRCQPHRSQRSCIPSRRPALSSIREREHESRGR